MVSAALKQGQGRLRRAFSGAAFVPRGLLYFLKHSWTWPLGALPIVLAVMLIVGVLAASWIGFFALLEWFRRLAVSLAGSGASPSTVNAIAIAIVVVAGSAISLLAILGFAEVVKTIGQPFWQSMCDRLERELGSPPPAPASGGFARVMKATRDSAIIVSIYLAIALPLLLLGFIPVAGQTLVPAAEALLAAWLISAELTQIPLERRGLTVLGRHRFLRAHRSETLGFGLAALGLFLIPGANVFAVPGAVIGGTLFIRSLEGRSP